MVREFLKPEEDGEGPKGETLREAFARVWEARWKGMRSEKCLMHQAEAAIFALEQETLEYVSEVQSSDVLMVTRAWYRQGLSPATINKRLNCLSALGVNVKGHRAKDKKALKWWLRPEQEKALVIHLRDLAKDTQHPNPHLHTLADFIMWTTRTGLRVEESLRLTSLDLGANFGEVTVPGTKTGEAQATLALSSEATAVLDQRYRRQPASAMNSKVFPITYDCLQRAWDTYARSFLAMEDNPTATLKGLRRSAARYLHYDRGMPLDMVRQYLRHEDIETTMGYLRLTGGVSLDEQRRYLG